jgi:hypothetical protein
MKIIELHDHLNPTQVVPVDAESIKAVTPFGSGSSVLLADVGVVAVHETPAQVEALMKEA